MFKKWIVISILAMVIAVIGSVFWVFRKTNIKFDKDSVEIFIFTGSDFSNVLQVLKPYLISEKTFVIASKLKGYDSYVKPGRYILHPYMNNTDIIHTLRSKNKTVKLQFNNQERLEGLASRISQQIEADSLSLMNVFCDTVFLKNNGFTLEQSLLMYIPNTYDFYWNTSAKDFQSRMLREYRKFWNEERLKKAKNQGLTPKQVSILASIIQKETSQNQEKPIIAGVYLNRLKKGMLLQADPTVIFAIKETTQRYDTVIKRVLYKDLQIDSPYNTYRNIGLPPAPITMPDISSVEAVLNPEKHDYLYFVADPYRQGFHKFASNYSQHNKNRQVYVQWIKKQGIQR